MGISITTKIQGPSFKNTTKNRFLALKCMSYGIFKKFTSEVEVKMEADVKIEVRFKQGIGRSITTKKFGVLALKMNK